MSGFVIKQGTTFLLGAKLLTFHGAPVDLTDTILTAQLRDVQNALIASLAVTQVSNRPGVVQISYAGDTSQWLVGQYRTDLRICWKNGLVQQSRTFSIMVIDGVTQNVTA
ncbi:hypothetical protein K6L44_09255 [Gluconacetobacter entanii]|uniref:hypothetical protein n=1 Tax=Gluconacetobacter entanii TaxID=108528 RepID=UPI001C93282D|nr:hypothetical protein [Gluconacetobacter entanii]MBY4640169.1 hypothetical protein [Gluconacetobacter entanii]MCW4580443.1 hypothetical protein [Gluconacetobacter entanii]MCW4583823.1 hypothetical protein [Gluconacetobacter entanii]MCW4587118.1 hypothetical protein [Gluconacetobacter entanii]